MLLLSMHSHFPFMVNLIAHVSLRFSSQEYVHYLWKGGSANLEMMCTQICPPLKGHQLVPNFSCTEIHFPTLICALTAALNYDNSIYPKIKINLL